MRFDASLFVLLPITVAVGAVACGSSSTPKQSAGAGAGGATTSSSHSGSPTASSSHASSGTGGAEAAGSSSSGTVAQSSSSQATSSSSSSSSSSGEGGAVSHCMTTSSSSSSSGATGGFPFPVVSYGGGTLIQAPKVVSITYPGDPDATSYASFGSNIASTCYWDAIRAGYCGNGMCIGDGPAGIASPQKTAAASSYTDSTQGGPASIQTYLSGLITSKAVPEPDANTLYMFYFPLTTTVSLDGAQSCQDFDGYHNSLMMNGQEVFYAVINECTAPQMTPQITTLQDTTITASHEIIEAASDGSSRSYGYYLDLMNPATYGWDDIQGGEIGDLCVDQFLLGLDEATEGAFTVQRIWSVTQAAAGKNPCVPVPAGEVYFNAFPVDSVIVMDVGASKTIEVDALADGPMGEWAVLPQDWSYGGSFLSFSIANAAGVDGGAQTMAQSGDKLQLTITLTADPSNTQYGEADGSIVSANNADPSKVTAAHFWPFIVVTGDAGLTMMARRQAHQRKTYNPRRRRNLFGGFRP